MRGIKEQFTLESIETGNVDSLILALSMLDLKEHLGMEVAIKDELQSY